MAWLVGIRIRAITSGRIGMTGLGGALAASTAESPLAIAAIGLIGSLIGGGIAATVSLRNAKRDRDAARTNWIRDNRQEIYNQFLRGPRSATLLERM